MDKIPFKDFFQHGFVLIAVSAGIISACSTNPVTEKKQAESVELHKWLLPETPPFPKDNKPTQERVQLGKMLFLIPVLVEIKICLVRPVITLR